MSGTETPLVSVIIPVYNDEPFLRQCLESAVNQTLSNIEIIVVDDASTDGSRAIAEQFASKDPRIRLSFNNENCGTLITRTRAVSLSTGDFIMFLDSDDEYCSETCETAYIAINEYEADIVHFDVEIINYSGFSSETHMENMRRFMAPFVGRLEKTDTLCSFSKDRKFSWNLCNKIFRGDICRKAFKEIEDVRVNDAEDVYLFFAVAYYSTSYAGIGRKLYKYHYGAGITGNGVADLDRVRGRIRIPELMKRFLCDKPDRELYMGQIADVRDMLLRSSVDMWLKNGKNGAWFDEGFKDLAETFGADIVPVIQRIAEKKKNAAIKNLKNELAEKDKQIEMLCVDLKNLEEELLKTKTEFENTKRSLDESDRELKSIQESKSYLIGTKLAMPIRKLRKK